MAEYMIKCKNCEKQFQFTTFDEVFLLSGDVCNIHELSCPFCSFKIIVKNYPELTDNVQENGKNHTEE